LYVVCCSGVREAAILRSGRERGGGVRREEERRREMKRVGIK